MSDNSISLNKFISSTGICSRREADKLIESGRVMINGAIAQKGNRVREQDEVLLDDTLIKNKPKSVYIAFNKPPGITCTTDPKDKKNIIAYVNHPKRIFPIGRLDKPTSGLILLTNDGYIVNQILREGNNNEKEYVVSVHRPIDSAFIKKMSHGIPILGTVTKKCKVSMINKTTFSIILTQGLNRQIRRMCEYLNYRVVGLQRIRIINIKLGNLKMGHWRNLNGEEYATLKKKLKE